MSRLRLIRDTSGFTLMELVVAMALGMVVLLAAFTIMDRAFFANKAVADREDALQRGRSALELMTRQLRSQVCAGTVSPTVDAEDNQVSFYVYTGDPTNAAQSKLPEMHTFSYVSSGSTGKITESDYKVTSIGATSVTVNSMAYRTATLATNVLPVPKASGSGNQPIFTYWAFDTSQGVGSGALKQLSSTPLSAADAGTAVKISVQYRVVPTGIRNPNRPDAHLTTFQGDAFWRAVNPEDPTIQPCSGS